MKGKTFKKVLLSTCKLHIKIQQVVLRHVKKAKLKENGMSIMSEALRFMNPSSVFVDVMHFILVALLFV